MEADKKAKYSDFPDAERDNFTAEEVSKESVNQMPDETVRQILRGDESKGDADDRDIAGRSATIDTQQGREEAKIKDKKV